MVTFVPVLDGGVSGLRQELEEQLIPSGNGALAEDLDNLTDASQMIGYEPLFSTDVECRFSKSPSADVPEEEVVEPEDLFLEVLEQMRGKAELHPGSTISPFLPSQYTLPFSLQDHKGSETAGRISQDQLKVRAQPAEALEALSRYWMLLNTMGKVAASHGYTAAINSTAINFSVGLDLTDTAEKQLDFANTVLGINVVAAAHHFLMGLHPLQPDAGLVPGWAAYEAFPSPYAASSVSDNQLGYKRPLLGATDLRLHMLCLLEGLGRAIDKDVPKVALNRIRPVRDISFYNRGPLDLGVLGALSVYDVKDGALATPAQLDPSAMGDELASGLVKFVDLAARTIGGQDQQPRPGQTSGFKAYVLEQTAQNFNLMPDDPDQGIIEVERNNNLAKGLDWFVESAGYVLRRDRIRIPPTYLNDDPEIQAQKRRKITRSKIVQNVLGITVKEFVPADEALARRQSMLAGPAFNRR